MSGFEIANQELERGVLEIPGPKDEERIVLYHTFTTLKAQDDETSWCAAFVNYCEAQANGYETGEEWIAAHLHGAGQANARSLLRYGQAADKPKVGDIVVYWRESKTSWKGHVGYVFAPDDGFGNVLTLGGNQGNRVSIKPYPQSRVLGYRRT